MAAPLLILNAKKVVWADLAEPTLGLRGLDVLGGYAQPAWQTNCFPAEACVAAEEDPHGDYGKDEDHNTDQTCHSHPVEVKNGLRSGQR